MVKGRVNLIHSTRVVVKMSDEDYREYDWYLTTITGLGC